MHVFTAEHWQKREILKTEFRLGVESDPFK